MAEQYSVEAILTAVDKSMSSVLNEVQKKVDSLDNTEPSFGDKIKSALFGIGSASSSGFGQATTSATLFGAAVGAASAVTQKAMSVVSSSLEGAISRVDTMNKFPKTMQLFGYSAEQSQAAINKLSNGIEGLPTTLDSAVSSAQQLTITVGDLDKGTDLALAFNNAMLGYGASSETATNALRQFNQSLGSGKIQGEEFNSIAEAAPGFMNKMAEAFGYGSNGVTDLKSALSSGEITAQQFADKMLELNDGVGGFAEMAQASSGGIATSFSNIKNAITKNLGNVINAIDQAASNSGLGSIAENLDKVKAAINSAFGSSDAMIQKFSSAFQSFFNPLLLMNFREGLEKVKGAFSSLSSAFSGVIGGNTAWILTLSNATSTLIEVVATGATIVRKFVNAFAQVGAIQAVKDAIDSVITAFRVLSNAVGESDVWATLGRVVGEVVSIFAKGVTIVADFISRMKPETISKITTVIVGLVAGVKTLNSALTLVSAIKVVNPFSSFGKSLSSAKKGATGLKGVFQNVGNTIKSIGSAIKSFFAGIGNIISTIIQGVGTAVATVFKGIAEAISLLNPAGVVAFALGLAAVTAALAGLSALKDLVLPFLQGLSTILVGLANGVLQAFANALVTLSPILTTLATALSLLSPLVVAFGTAFSLIATAVGEAISQIVSALPPLISAFGTAVAEITTALTPIVQIVGDVFVQIVSIVSDAIVQIVQALAPFIPEITSMVEAVAPVLSKIVEAFNNLISQIRPIIDSIANLFKTLGEQISNILDSASTVIESFGSSIRNVLDGISGIFDSIGNAAKNAGEGVKLMAQGVKILVDLKLGDLAATLATVASGLAAVVASGIGSAGPGLLAAGQGLMLIATAGQAAQVALTSLPMTIMAFSSSLTSLPATMSSAQSAISTFAQNAVKSLNNLSNVNTSISAFSTKMTLIAAAATIASSGLTTFNGQANRAASALSLLGSRATSSSSQVQVLGATITSAMSNATSSITSAGTRMVATMQSSMNLIVNAVRNGMTNAVSAVRNGTSQMVSAMRSSSTSMVTAAQSMVNRSVSTIRSGYSSMYSAGAYITQGVAAGMNSALSSVTAAANKIVAQAEKAAKAAAEIHSPSHLFRDEIGYYIGAGIAVGIDRSASLVESSLSAISSMVSDFDIADYALNASDTASSLQASVNMNAANFARNISSTSSQDSLLAKVDELIEEVKNGSTMYMDGSVVASNVDSRLGSKTSLGGRFSF